MRKRISNSEIMKLFQEAEEIKKTESNKSVLDGKIKKIHDSIIDKLSFLVYTKTSCKRGLLD
jgi:hypothetical protein